MSRPRSFRSPLVVLVALGAGRVLLGCFEDDASDSSTTGSPDGSVGRGASSINRNASPQPSATQTASGVVSVDASAPSFDAEVPSNDAGDDGSVAIACEAGISCGSSCVDPTSDIANCGACGVACAASANMTAACTSGTCGASCNAGYGDCNDTPSDGCESVLATDSDNCGACGNACAGATWCIAGTCTCGAGAGALDQSQLASNGDYVDSATQVVGQSFVVGQSGVLTGIEVGTDVCNGVDPNATMTLTVTSNGTTLGAASLTAAQIPVGGCGADPLDASTIGAGFFDLSASCIAVNEGDALAFTLTITTTTPGSCIAGRCVGGVDGGWCEGSEECGYSPRIGLQGGNVYAGGTAIVNGHAQSDEDVAFKTFVRSDSRPL